MSEFRVVQMIGNRGLMERSKTLFVCSKRAPVEVYGQVFAWVDSLTAEDTVMCCDTSALEEEVLKALLVRNIPVVLVVMNRFRRQNNFQIELALKENRMLVMVLKQGQSHRWHPAERNKHLMNLANQIVGGYINRQGSLLPLLSEQRHTTILSNNFATMYAAENDRHYQRWTVAEDRTLLRMYYEDQSIHDIHQRLGRSYLAVRERIHSLTMPEDLLKGREFEELVLELLDVKGGRHLLKEWRGDKTLGKVSPENNRLPDLIVEDTATQRTVAIECKWRKMLTADNVQDLFESERIELFERFACRRKTPVFFLIGIGGEPSEPLDIYIVPLAAVTELIAHDDTPWDFESFKRRETFAPLTFDEMTPRTTFSDIRQQYPNAYKPWSEDDERRLANLYASGTDIDKLSHIFGRQPGGIRSRLKKWGLIL